MAACVWRAGALVISLAAAEVPAAAFGQSSSNTEPVVPATVALVETWSDGRVNYELTSPRRNTMWTPYFPRVDGYEPPEGVARVYAVQLSRILIGRDIKVEVSVLLGSARPPAVPVTTVLISPGSRVVVDELLKFGVQPVTLSMEDVAPMTPYLPTALSVSPQIEISKIEVLNAPYPGYRLTLRNLGELAVSNVHVQSYRGAEKALSGLKRTEDGHPLMQPGATYTFDMNLTSGIGDGAATPGTWTPRAIDVIELDSVRWADGTSDGSSPFPNIEPTIERDSGQRLQLRRIVDALRQTLAEQRSGLDLLDAARSRLAALPDAEPEQLALAKAAMRSTKAAALSDLARFGRDPAAPPETSAVLEWLTIMHGRYQAWLTRLSPP